VCAVNTAGTTPNSANATTATTSSKGENVSELVARVSTLARAADWWADVGLGLLILAALVAAVTVGAQYMSIRRGRELNRAQNELASMKDAELNRELDARRESIAKLNVSVTEARTRQADAAARLKSVEGETAKQQERAAKAEKELVELRETLKPRTLTAEVRTQLIDALKSSSVKGPVLVTCIAGDSESCLFAREIRACLELAGWPVPELGAIQTLPGYGLMIRVRDASGAPKHAEELQRILGSVGLPAPGDTVPTMPSACVMLWVGSKRL
jgi:hypothetical protein